MARAMATRLLLSSAQLHGGQFGAVLQSHDIEILLRFLDGLIPGLSPEDQWNRCILRGRQAGEEVVVLKNESDFPQPEVGKLVGIQPPNVSSLQQDLPSVDPPRWEPWASFVVEIVPTATMLNSLIALMGIDVGQSVTFMTSASGGSGGDTFAWTDREPISDALGATTRSPALPRSLVRHRSRECSIYSYGATSATVTSSATSWTRC